MPIIKIPDTAKYSNYQICEKNVYALLYDFILFGRVVDPNIVNLPSFDIDTLKEFGFEFEGNVDEFSVFHACRFFPSNKKTLILTEFKVYFFKNIFWTNGFGILGNIRVVTLQKILYKYMVNKEKKTVSQLFPASIYFSDELEEGAIIYNNGIVIRFSSRYPSHFLNYYVRTVESSFSAISELNARAININSIEGVFKKYSLLDMHMCKHKNNKAFKKLLDFFISLPELITV